MHRLLILLAIVLAGLSGTGPASGAQDWVVVKADGRDYLTMDNIAEFYGLSAVKRNDREASATSGVRNIRTTAGSPDFSSTISSSSSATLPLSATGRSASRAWIS